MSRGLQSHQRLLRAKRRESITAMHFAAKLHLCSKPALAVAKTPDHFAFCRNRPGKVWAFRNGGCFVLGIACQAVSAVAHFSALPQLVHMLLLLIIYREATVSGMNPAAPVV